jgi:hypothetical protein
VRRACKSCLFFTREIVFCSRKLLVKISRQGQVGRSVCWRERREGREG